MTKNSIAGIARIVFAITMLVFAYMHFANADYLKAAVPAYLPGGEIWVYFTGVALALAGIAFILNIKTSLAGYLLGLMLLLFVVLIHIPAMVGGDEGAMAMVLKDTGLAAAAFFIGAKS